MGLAAWTPCGTHEHVLSSLLGTVRIVLMFGSVLLALLVETISRVVLALTALKEEAYLRRAFDLTYDDYASEPPVFWPRLIFTTMRQRCHTPRGLRGTGRAVDLPRCSFVP